MVGRELSRPTGRNRLSVSFRPLSTMITMTLQNTLRFTLLLVLVGALTACDDSSQNIGWEPGDELNIVGPATVEVPATGEYYVQAFTIEKNYTWDVAGPGTPEYDVRREGEYVDVTFDEAGTYTISIDDGVEYDGSLDVEAALVDVVTQATRFYPTLADAVDEAGLVSTLADASDITVFAPTDEAFAPVAEALDGELPAPGVLADILTYHVAGAAIASGDISDGDTAATLYGDAYPLSFSIDGGTVSVNGAANSATVTDTDIPVANESALHEIDTVLLPPTASVDASDQAVVDADGTLTATVDGVYLPEGGFAVIEADDEIIGHSAFVEAGLANDVTVELAESLDSDTEVNVVVYADTDGDEAFDADADAPYERDATAVSDEAVLSPVE